MCLIDLAALIPLSEFSDPIISKKYGVKPDAETLDIVNCVARQKDVNFLLKIYAFQSFVKLCLDLRENEGKERIFTTFLFP